MTEPIDNNSGDESVSSPVDQPVTMGEPSDDDYFDEYSDDESIGSRVSQPVIPAELDNESDDSWPPTTEPVDYLRAMYPDIDELWEPAMSFVDNVARIASGEVYSGQKGLQNAFGTYIPAIETFLNIPEEKNADGEILSLETRRAQRKDLIRAFDKPNQTQQTPPLTLEQQDSDRDSGGSSPLDHDRQGVLLRLQQQITAIFQHGNIRAGGMHMVLMAAAQAKAQVIVQFNFDANLNWNSPIVAARLIGTLAGSDRRLRPVWKHHSPHYRGVFPYKLVRNTRSKSLKSEYEDAKARACGEERKTSVITVNLLDVHSIELLEQDQEKRYTDFSHAFVLGIGPEGFIIWQAHEHGYGLDEWIRDGNARLRNWQEADEFVDEFEKFATFKVSRLRIY